MLYTYMYMKDIPGLEGLYAATKDGRIYSFPKGQRNTKGMFLRPWAHNGYLKVTITEEGVGKRGIRVHRLIALVFIPNPLSLPHINHINGVKTDNRAENLEWSNPSINAKHAWDMGLNIMTEKRAAGLELGRV